MTTIRTNVHMSHIAAETCIHFGLCCKKGIITFNTAIIHFIILLLSLFC